MNALSPQQYSPDTRWLHNPPAGCTLPPLEAGAMTYMMSKQQYLNDGAHNWMPHLMFYFPRADGAAWGADLPGRRRC